MRRHVTRRLEAARVVNGSLERKGGDWADSRNGHESFAQWICLHQRLDSVVQLQVGLVENRPGSRN